MSDSLVRLKVNSSEWDSKLKNASDQLNRYMEGCRKAGGTLEILDEGVMDVVKSFGKMETASNTARGRIAELTKSFTDLSFQYKQMSDAEKQSEPGKALRESLDQLKSRIIDAKKDLSDINAELSETGKASNNAGSGLGSLNSIFGASITKLAGWGAAIAAAKGALDVAKDAFFASEQNVDAWGRTIESTQAVYEAFLTSINSGDISGFLSRIGQITNAAIEAYNALDQLSTQKTIQSPQVAVKQAEISRMRTMLQTGRYVAPADGRSTGGMKTGDMLTKEQIANISKNLEQALNEVATITRSQVKTASTAIDKLYAEQAAVLGVSKQRFQQATSSWQNFQDSMGKANAYEKWRKENTTYTTQTTSTGAVIRTANYDDSKNPYRDWAWVSRFKDDGERFQRLIQEIQNRESAKSTLYSQYGQAYRRINRAEGVNPYGSTGSGKAASEKTDTELKQNEAAIAKLTEQYQKLATEAKTADDAQRAGISTRMNEIQGEIKLLSDRNAELKRFSAEAQGMKVSVGISSSLPELNEQLKQLQQAQSQALNNADWTAYGKQIEQVQAQIEALKGKWKEGLQATFRIKAEVPAEKTVVFKADDTDVLEKARQISGVHIDDKTLTVTALTEDAEVALRNLDGIKPLPKFLTVTALTAEAEESLRKMGAEQIGDKTFRITAEMADTLTQLQDVNAYHIDDKSLTVTALTAEAEESIRRMGAEQIGDKTFRITAEMADTITQLQDVNAYHIDDKSLTVTALTAEAEESLRKMGAEQIGDKTFRITAEMADTLTQLQDVNAYHIDDKTLTVTALTADAEESLRRMGAEQIGDKTFRITAEMADTITQLQQVNAYHIDDKTLTVTALTADAEESLRKMGAEQIGDKTFRITAEMADTITQLQQVNAYHIDDKTLTVTALTAEAEESIRRMGAEQIGDKTFRVTAEMADTLTQLQQVNAYKISDKEVAVNVETQAAIDKLKDIDGVTIDPKTMTVTANTAEAYNKCQELFKDIEGTTVEFSVVPSQSDLTNNNLATIISDIKKQIDRAEIGSLLYNNLTARLADANAIGNLIRTAVQNGLDTSQLELDEFWQNIIKGENIPDTQLQTIVDRINEYLKDKHIELNFDVGTVTEKKGEEDKKGKSESSEDEKKSNDKVWIQNSQKVASGLSSVSSGLQSMGIKLPDGLSKTITAINGLMSVINGVNSIISVFTSTTASAEISATTANTAALIANTAALGANSSANILNAVIPFARGGKVPHAALGAYIGGNHYSGDVTPVLANAGEVILNKSQQGNLVSQLQDSERQTGGNAQPFVTGEQIYLGLNNYLRRTGRGELMTARG